MESGRVSDEVCDVGGGGGLARVKVTVKYINVGGRKGGLQVKCIVYLRDGGGSFYYTKTKTGVIK